MGIVDDLKTLLSGRTIPWDQPYENMTMAELVQLKVEQQVLRDASDDPAVRAACNARIAVINPFLDQRVADADADRVLSKLSDQARDSFALRVQNLKSKTTVKNG